MYNLVQASRDSEVSFHVISYICNILHPSPLLQDQFEGKFRHCLHSQTIDIPLQSCHAYSKCGWTSLRHSCLRVAESALLCILDLTSCFAFVQSSAIIWSDQERLLLTSTPKYLRIFTSSSSDPHRTKVERHRFGCLHISQIIDLHLYGLSCRSDHSSTLVMSDWILDEVSRLLYDQECH